MGEDSERAARQTGGGVGWQNIWRLTAGMCRNQGMNNWKGTGKRQRDRKRREANKNPAREGPGSAFPHFPFGIICQFNRSDNISITCVLDQSYAQPKINSITVLSSLTLQERTFLSLPPLEGLFLLYNSEIYAFNLRSGHNVCKCSGHIKSKQLCNQQFNG